MKEMNRIDLGISIRDGCGSFLISALLRLGCQPTTVVLIWNGRWWADGGEVDNRS